ncbi:hypothetical protein AX16_008499, partial [Volvariella volvacea WC 439]
MELRRTATLSVPLELEDDSEEALERNSILKNMLGKMYTVGVDTVASATSTLAMVQNPGCLKKGRTEIRRIIGLNRLPEFSDKDNLPYVQALIQETLRWKPVSPLGMARLVSTKGMYRGYTIPKDSILVKNL